MTGEHETEANQVNEAIHGFLNQRFKLTALPPTLYIQL